MEDTIPGVVIVGAGHGGTQAAASLRENGYTKPVTLVSADEDFPYHKPPLSKSFMKTPDAALQSLRGPRFFEENSIETMLGTSVTAIDCAGRQVTLSNGETLDYEALVLATGTVARRLSIPGADLAGVHHLRTAHDARALRDDIVVARRAVIVGGGFIGLEAAAMLAARGLEVTVVEVADRLMGRAASPQVAAAIGAGLESQGVKVLTGTGVQALVGQDGRVSSVRLSDGQSLDCDLVLAGIGATPDISLAEAAGLTLDNGIRVDTKLATSDPAIFAIGDCCNFPDFASGRRLRLESVQNATDQARAVASTLCGSGVCYGAVPWFWSDIGATKLQIAGLAEGSDTTLPITDPATGALRAVYHLKDGIIQAVETLNSAGEHMLARKILSTGRTPDPALIAAGDIKGMKAFVMG
ncbi:FAD-dependent oxidoreductase [Marinovum sp.]|uniref:NAD(P)/FAD-dependent oxidoreductase n=1 Tax=Marinovum sp. TaxID=2024839 RepID=UPI002B27B832|nr:FAD-dependent oxidoreductase [Marinovum sp.]